MNAQFGREKTQGSQKNDLKIRPLFFPTFPPDGWPGQLVVRVRERGIASAQEAAETGVVSGLLLMAPPPRGRPDNKWPGLSRCGASFPIKNTFAAKESGARRLQTGGFTLVEMMMTLVVFLLLAAALFGIMTGVLESTSTLMDNQNRRDQIEALNAFMGKRLDEMTAQATIGSYQRGDGEGLVQNGIIFGTANLATAIDAKVQPNGYYVLRLVTYQSETEPGEIQPPDARVTLQQAVTSDDPTLVWTTLIGDLKTLDWKFLDFNATEWVDLWNSPSKPNLVEFSMQPAGELQPVTMDFWLPQLAPAVITTGARSSNP